MQSNIDAAGQFSVCGHNGCSMFQASLCQNATLGADMYQHLDIGELVVRDNWMTSDVSIRRAVQIIREQQDYMRLSLHS